MRLKDWVVFIAVIVAVAIILAFGAYSAYLDVQWKRAIINRRAP